MKTATLSTPPSTGLSGIQFPHLIDMFSMIPKDISITTLRMKRGETFYSRHTSTTSAVVKVITNVILTPWKHRKKANIETADSV